MCSGVNVKTAKAKNVSTKTKTSMSKNSTKTTKSRTVSDKKEAEPIKESDVMKLSNTQYKKKVSLRDLRPEDKKRVANLIQELARIGEEKENVVEQLYSQRHEYDQYIQNLLDQQEMIVKERENVMKQLHECQIMLGKYQKAMADEKINHEGRKVKKEKEKNEFVFKPRPVPTSSGGNETDSCNGIPGGRTVEKSAITEDFDVTPGGTRRRSRLPSAETGSRPFTNMIDQLIEQEKSSMASPVSSIRPSSANSVSSKSSNTDNPKRNVKTDEIVKGKLFGIGPLPAPILSSTHTSDLVSNATNSPSVRQQSRTRAQDFAPMSMDATETMSVRSEDICAISEKDVEDKTKGFRTPTKSRHERLEAEKNLLLKEQEKLRKIIAEQQKQLLEPLHVNTPMQKNLPNFAENKVTFNSPVPQELADGSDQEMLKYYSELSPRKRQEEMNVQKEALLLEQQKLKEILTEQERLLKTKQEQLHHQQQLQRHRLEFFQETGYFPSAQGMDTLVSASSGSKTVGHMLSQYTSSATSNIPNTTPSSSNSSHYTNDSCSSHYVDSHSAALEIHSDYVGANFTNTKPRHTMMETRSEDFAPTGDFHDVENQILQESPHNLCVVDNVPGDGIQTRKRESVVRPTKRPGISLESRELLNSFSASDPLQSLADIIDEVESLQSQPNTSPGGGETHLSLRSSQSGFEALNNAALTELLNDDAVRELRESGGSQVELEESQLLDDVFFVHK